MGNRRVVGALALAALIVVPAKAEAAPQAQFVNVLKGWRTTLNRPVPGVEVLRMAKGDAQRVSVVAVAPKAQVRFKHAVGRGRLSGKTPRTERTSKMCRRNNCIAAINGAFFDRKSGLPYSGITSSGELIRSVTSNRPHVAIDQGLRFGETTPSVILVAIEPDIFNGGSRFEEQEMRFPLRGVNRARGPNGISVFSRRWGPMAPPVAGRELVLHANADPALVVGTAQAFTPIALRQPGGAIPDNGIVLSGLGDGAKLLADLWRRINEGTLQSVLSIEVDRGPEILIGTRPLILRNDRIIQDPSAFARGRHPRTILAAKSDGTVLFVVIDGRAKKRRGMSLRQAAVFVQRLGAMDATNLDGGGSSALAVKGKLHSRPPGKERSVSTALMIVPR